MNIIHTGCWHLGHPRTPTKHIYESLKGYLFPRLADAQLLILAGDLFDRLVDFDGAEAIYIDMIFGEMAQLCITYDVRVVVLRGTYSHDKNQLGYVISLMKRSGLTKISYHSTLGVEHIEDLGLWIGFLPDNTHHKDTYHVLDDFAQHMGMYGINKLDYLVTHNTYDVLGLPIHKGLVLNLSDMETIVEKRICSGHIHTPSSHGKLLYAGSFDRLAHGEEHPKGYWIIHHEKNKAEFIVNEHAYDYVTLDVTKTQSDVIDYIRLQGDVIEKCDNDKDVNLRVILTEEDFVTMRVPILTFFRENYPLVKVTFAEKGKIKQEEYSSLELKEAVTELEVINEATLSSIIFNRLQKKDVSLSLEDIKHILQG